VPVRGVVAADQVEHEESKPLRIIKLVTKPS
jgi:hypothetical protein